MGGAYKGSLSPEQPKEAGQHAPWGSLPMRSEVALQWRLDGELSGQGNWRTVPPSLAKVTTEERPVSQGTPPGSKHTERIAGCGLYQPHTLAANARRVSGMAGVGGG